MANINFVNKTFKQKGDVCALASYSIVIEYFSDKNIRVEKIFDKYVDTFNVRYISLGPNKHLNKEKAIFEHFHKHCHPRNLRGFDFIKQLHEEDKLKTEQYCKIILSKAQLTKISDEDIAKIREELKSNEALAIILYKVETGKFHAVTIGYDLDESKYFYKDPEQSVLKKGDVLSEKEISEFIVFNETK